MTASYIGSLLKQAWNEFSEDKAMRLAAALACYTILTLAPMVVITMKVSTAVLHDKARTGQVESQMKQLVGEQGGKASGDMIASDKTQNSGGLATIVSL